MKKNLSKLILLLIIIITSAVYNKFFANSFDDEYANTPSDLYKVVKVVDGDTIKVNIKGQIETVRLIGLDTPEIVDPRKTVQCFALEASNKAKEMLSDKNVKLETDSTQGELDKYGRLLRYVFLEDGTLYNKFMIAEGYAHEYTYQSNPYKYQAEFIAAEVSARENQKGLWSATTCNGDTVQSAKK
jgi:micrococcal nuclease